MHFSIQMCVRLAKPLPVTNDMDVKEEGLSEITGYVIVIGINASDLATAVQDAQRMALNPKRADGTFDHYDGFVEEAEVKHIEKDAWDPFILKHAVNIDQPGVYYSTGLIYFNHADKELKKK
jgi:hypothetical protein